VGEGGPRCGSLGVDVWVADGEGSRRCDSVLVTRMTLDRRRKVCLPTLVVDELFKGGHSWL
jgi:hypothetical protein